MPSKRRRSTILHSPRSLTKKARRNSDVNYELQTFLHSTLSLVQNLRDDNNRPISKEYLRLPNKKNYPDYYSQISNPISLTDIKGKINTKHYTDPKDFLHDIKLMADNSSTYNETSSLIAQDARHIYNFVSDQVKQFLGEKVDIPRYERRTPSRKLTSSSSAASNDSFKKPTKLHLNSKKSISQEHPDTLSTSLKIKLPLKKLEKQKISLSNDLFHIQIDDSLKSKLTTIMESLINYKDEEAGQISLPFMIEPDKVDYPDYYQIIKNPIAINTVLKKITGVDPTIQRSNKRKGRGRKRSSITPVPSFPVYQNFQEFKTDLFDIFKNAQTYNQEGSLIYEHSKILEKELEKQLTQLLDSLDSESSKTQENIANIDQDDLDRLENKKRTKQPKSLAGIKLHVKNPSENSSSSNVTKIKLKLRGSKENKMEIDNKRIQNEKLQENENQEDAASLKQEDDESPTQNLKKSLRLASLKTDESNNNFIKPEIINSPSKLRSHTRANTKIRTRSRITKPDSSSFAEDRTNKVLLEHESPSNKNEDSKSTPPISPKTSKNQKNQVPDDYKSDESILSNDNEKHTGTKNIKTIDSKENLDDIEDKDDEKIVDEEENKDKINSKIEGQDNNDTTKILKSEEPPLLLEYPSFVITQRKLIQPKSSPLILEISISSSKNTKGTHRQNFAFFPDQINMNSLIMPTYFEYKFESSKANKISDFAINLPQSKNAITILMSLNDILINKNYVSGLLINGERANPSPSMTYADSGKVLTSKYEVRLANGINNIQFLVQILANSRERVAQEIIEEKVDFWVQVSQ
ncbi:bromodomain-containing protein [Ascoidea rubescens DSM 1968]|uniref:Bromodomain-containing protein n=1 Tax=Ascoidea rubescens DSM 1968 TaxID=1344418 RepID=A0A1D2VKQ1_9ASCO|nr:Bromodomain-containing protein [Ascoidea rubescens DSM 1968]ODV62193.1 Bromodomain-containing protein [Ascoidea rubescens DSM 1968]